LEWYESSRIYSTVGLMNKSTLLILILAGALLLSLFFHVEQNEISEAYRLEKESAQRHIKKQIDSVNRQIRAKDEQLLKLMRESAYADMLAAEAVKKAEYYRKKYEKIPFKPIATDHLRDSSIRAILQH